MPTSARALDTSLLHIIQTWRMGCGSRVAMACCKYHAAINTMAVRAKKLRKGRCLQDFKFFEGAQCPRCGIAGHFYDDSGCILCEIAEERFPSILEQGPKRRRPLWQRTASEKQDLLSVQAMTAAQHEAALHAGEEGPQAQSQRPPRVAL